MNAFPQMSFRKKIIILCKYFRSIFMKKLRTLGVLALGGMGGLETVPVQQSRRTQAVQVMEAHRLQKVRVQRQRYQCTIWSPRRLSGMVGREDRSVRQKKITIFQVRSYQQKPIHMHMRTKITTATTSEIFLIFCSRRTYGFILCGKRNPQSVPT